MTTLTLIFRSAKRYSDLKIKMAPEVRQSLESITEPKSLAFIIYDESEDKCSIAASGITLQNTKVLLLSRYKLAVFSDATVYCDNVPTICEQALSYVRALSNDQIPPSKMDPF